MALSIKNKRSGSAGNEPTPGDLEYGEIAVNYNESDPALYVKDSDNVIRRIAGAGSVSSGIEEAPNDGKIYGRKDDAWEPSVDASPNDGKTYGRKNDQWSEIEPGGVTQIVAGNNVTISPSGGTGVVTVNSTGGGGGSGVSSIIAGEGIAVNQATGDVTITNTGGDYDGASAWGTFDGTDGSLENGLNIASVTRTNNGQYTVVFSTAMPSANYSVVASSSGTTGNNLGNVDVVSQSSAGFDLKVADQSNNANDAARVNFAVFATNALPPKGGTGTDAWASVQADGTIDASFNVASVTKVSTGKHDVVFTTPMPTANYAVLGTTWNPGTTVSGTYAVINNKTSAGFTLYTYTSGTVSVIDSPFSFTVNATNATLPLTVTQEQIEAAINNPGLSAWANVAPNGTIEGGNNVASVVKTGAASTARYALTFQTPMPDDNYSVVGTCYSLGITTGVWVVVTEKSATGFTYFQTNYTGVVDNNNTMLQIASTNALPPKGGTGTDAWASVLSDGTIDASFNVASVTKITTGTYDVVFTTQMPTANYAVTVGIDHPNSLGQASVRSKTSSGFQIFTGYITNSQIIADFGFDFTVNATNAVLPDSFSEEQIQSVVDLAQSGATNPGASAWGDVAADGTLQGGLNATVTKTGTGTYAVTFITPLPNDDYAVTAATAGGYIFAVGTKTANGFDCLNYTPTGAIFDTSFNFAVFATNALPPKGGTGTDAWGSIDGITGNILSSFNASSSKVSTGLYQVTFTTPMPNANYAPVVSSEISAAIQPGSVTTNGFQIVTFAEPSVGPADLYCTFQVNATNATLPNTVTQEQIDAAINNPGLSAWGSCTAAGATNNSLNIASVTRSGVGTYLIVFQTPMPSADYSVDGTATGNYKGTIFAPTSKTALGFTAQTYNPVGLVNIDADFDFQVAATNAVLPKGGTGTDSWGSCQADATIDASFNVASVTRISEGIWDVVFTSPMPTANYAVTGSSNSTTSGTYWTFSANQKTTTGFRCYVSRSQPDTGDIIYQDSEFSFTVNATNATLPSTITQEQAQEVLNFIATGGNAPVAILSDIQTASEASTSGWKDRTFNTVDDAFNLVSLDANETDFTLQPGAYLIEWFGTSLQSGYVKSRLSNVTTGATVGLGSSSYSNSTGDYACVMTHGTVRVQIASASAFKIEQYSSATSGYGFGIGASQGGEDDLFAQVTITGTPSV